MKRILYLEDDFIDAEDTKESLANSGQVQVVKTEHEFRQTIDDCALSGNWPDIVILDQRVRWTNPAKVMPPVPEDVKEGGWKTAGIRSYDYLRKRQPGHRKTPVIFYSLVDSERINSYMASRGGNADPRDYQSIGKIEGFGALHLALKLVA